MNYLYLSGAVALILAGVLGYGGFKFYQSYQNTQQLLTQAQQEVRAVAETASTTIAAAQTEVQKQALVATLAQQAMQSEAGKASAAQKAAELAQATAATAQQAAAAAQAASEASAATAKAAQGPSLSSLISEWSPAVPMVGCSFADGTEEFGSGTLIEFGDGGIDIVTNAHVVTEDFTSSPTACVAQLSGDGNYQSWKSSSGITVSTNGFDWALMKVTGTNLDNYIAAHSISSSKLCQTTPNIGDSIVILGYPGNGATQSITATQGIISGYDNGYYVTSTVIDHGSSGGAAIDVQNDCYLGIPTYVLTNTESFARILEWQDWYKSSGTQTSSTVSTGSTNSGSTSQDSAAINYYLQNKTCVGLSGQEYSDCLSYAYNH